MEICWAVLRFFGYDNDLRIISNLWDDKSIPQQDIDSARSFDLKKGAIDFLAQLYHSEVRNNVFNQASLERVFFTSPFGCCWTLTRETVVDAK